MVSIFEYSLQELQNSFVENGYKKYSATQVFDWIYKKKVFDFSLMTNVSKDLREYLKNTYSFSFPIIDKKQVSSDSTVKYLFKYEDGSKVEAVLMNHNYGTSLCVSSEVGCNMGCAFCASGLKKKSRNLSAAEMVSGLLKVEEDLTIKVSHVVIMGTGEPLDNFDEVLKFISIINSPYGLEIGIRHITLSTAGLVPKIYDLAKMDLPINLAISLHAPTNELRNKLMPVNKAYQIEELIQAAKDYFDATGRRITFEYLLLKEVNDTELCADKLADLVKGLNCYINLIPYNEVEEFDFKTSDEKRVNRFYDLLKKRGINVTLRKKMGDDIDAACGQLRSKNI